MVRRKNCHELKLGMLVLLDRVRREVWVICYVQNLLSCFIV